jgi:hypothetical protein
MNPTLVIVPCGQSKVWDRSPGRGPTLARDAYTGGPFKVNRAYAERHGDRWIILSALYGLIAPDFLIPGPYNVTFKKKTTQPISVSEVRRQIAEQQLDKFPRVIGLGGKEYRAILEAAFGSFGRRVEFPFTGLKIGDAMHAEASYDRTPSGGVSLFGPRFRDIHRGRSYAQDPETRVSPSSHPRIRLAGAAAILGKIRLRPLS